MIGLPDIASNCRAGLLVAALGVTLGGCATLPSASPDGDDGRSRAERVFLYQSRVADALLDRYPLMEVFEEADPALVAAEQRMTETCSPLTRAVLAHLEGEKPSLGLRFRVITTIGECERAARRIDRILSDAPRTAANIDSI